VLAQFEGGNTLTATIDVVTRHANRSFRYMTEKGALYWDINSHAVKLHLGDADTWKIFPETPISGLPSDWSLFDIYRDETRLFIDACNKKATFPNSFDNNLRLCRLVQACEKSSAEGVVVNLKDK